jgi:hypothetical protein
MPCHKAEAWTLKAKAERSEAKALKFGLKVP